MDCRKLHFGMRGIDIMTMRIHALLQVSLDYCSLQVVPLVLVKVADN